MYHLQHLKRGTFFPLSVPHATLADAVNDACRLDLYFNFPQNVRIVTNGHVVPRAKCLAIALKNTITYARATLTQGLI